MLRHELSARFEQCWEAAGGEASKRVFQDIAARYSEARRHYHTLEHVAHCLSEIDIPQLDAGDRLAVELAIWFHDVVYEIPGSGNERRSAEYFKQFAVLTTLSPEAIDRVVTMILASEKHAADRADKALQIFLDIDLAILGASPERFRQYDRDIRTEYSSIFDAIYYPKRRQLLRQFLMRDAIYLTPEFRDRYEARARENLRSVVESEPGAR
jgi:predicted metal-dependent HD superfamily phosphohydrolase